MEENHVLNLKSGLSGCKTRENSNFLKKRQNGHFGKNPKFF